MSLYSDIITDAFEDLGVIAVGESITTAMQTDAFNRLLMMLDSFSAEGLIVPLQVMQTFQLQANINAYTLGSGGSFATTGGLRAQKITAWRAFYSTILQDGGRVLSMAEFGERSKLSHGEQSTIPSIVGADTNYPLINVRVSPSPSAAPGQLELAYWTPLVKPATVGDTVTVAPGLEDFLHAHLAQRLYPQYPRPSNRDMIWDLCTRTKAALVEQNAMGAPQPAPSAPQGQQ